MSKDARVDDYIDQSAPFARPILRHVRKLVHQACPEVEETIKWGFPHFDYHGMMIGMAAFKEHCSAGFWKGELVLNKHAGADGGMGHFGRIKHLKDLPNNARLVEHIRKAAQLNRDGITSSRVKKPKEQRRPSLSAPEYFEAALKKNRKAAATFHRLSYSQKKEYLEWITEAKREDTREKRLKTALIWLAEGKPRNWKYIPGFQLC